MDNQLVGTGEDNIYNGGIYTISRNFSKLVNLLYRNPILWSAPLRTKILFWVVAIVFLFVYSMFRSILTGLCSSRIYSLSLSLLQRSCTRPPPSLPLSLTRNNVWNSRLAPWILGQRAVCVCVCVVDCGFVKGDGERLSVDPHRWRENLICQC